MHNNALITPYAAVLGILITTALALGFAIQFWIRKYGKHGPEPDSKTVENFQIIGHGACGPVFLTTRKVNNEVITVAAKYIFNPENHEEIMHLLSEIQILSTECPFVLKILDYQYVPMPHQHIAVFTEYCEEGTLTSISRKGQMGTFRLYDCLVQVLRGLDYLHSHGIIHRDIKGDNVLLIKKREHDCIKIGDFDYSKLLNKSNSQLCSVTAGIGTRAFMAPEVIQGRAGDAHIGRKADVWSFACMVVELANGGEIRYFRKKDGNLIDFKRDKSVDLLLEIANGAIPEMHVQTTDSEKLILFAFFEDLLQSCWRPASVGGCAGWKQSAEIRPDSHDLLLRFTHKICRRQCTAGFPNLPDYGEMGMMLFKPWVRDRIRCLQSYYHNIDPTKKLLYTSAYDWKHVSVDGMLSQRCDAIVCVEEVDCLVALVVEAGFETSDNGAGFQRNLDDARAAKPWLMLLALCKFRKGDSVHSSDVAGVFDFYPHTGHNVHHVLHLKCKLGITEYTPGIVMPFSSKTHFEYGLNSVLRQAGFEGGNGITYGEADIGIGLDTAGSAC